MLSGLGTLTPWTPFQPVKEAREIAHALANIPQHWSLTPLREKRPYRDRWQHEPFIPHCDIARFLVEGENCISKTTGKSYLGYSSGYGLRLGDASGGLVAIDIDGASAEPLLIALSGGDLPLTVSWTSGLSGRRQLLYQIPADFQKPLQGFRRKTYTKVGELEVEAGELLEFRYNRHQSALPPSRHPETGAYRWLHSPQDVPVAIAPLWLCELLVGLGEEKETRSQVVLSKRPRQLDGFCGDSRLQDLLARSVDKLGVEGVFDWEGHQFHRLGKTLRGFCPQHKSHSGTAFSVDPETLEWYCFGCETGGGAVQYRYFRQGGLGTPNGKEFIAIVQQLARDAGVEQHWQEPYRDRAKHTWERSKSFTPNQTIERAYFDWEVPPEGTIFAVKSGLGTGKTAWIERVVRQLPGEGWIALGHRNSLLLQSCQRWGFEHLHSDEAYDRLSHRDSKLALCVDSLLHFEAEDFDGKNIILDEAVAIAMHLLIGGTLKRNRDRILAHFGDALRRARRVICLDGMLADWCVDYFHRLAGEERELIKVENLYRLPPLQIEFLTATWDGMGKYRSGDRSPLLQQLWQSERPVICTDSQLEAEALDRVLQEAGKSGIRIDSKTVTEAEIRALLESPNEFIQRTQPDYLIYTPSAEAGIDISTRDYFSDQFCLFFGVLQTHAQLQMIGRIRDPEVKRWIWCRNVGFPDTESDRSLFPRQVARALEEFLLQEGLTLIEGQQDLTIVEQFVRQVLAANQDIHHQAFCVIKAIANYERGHLRECLFESLEAAGHQVREMSLATVKASSQREKAAKDAVKIANARRIFAARPASIGKIEILKNQPARDAIARSSLLKQLPGIEKMPQWTPEFIKRVKYDDRQFIAKQELFWLIHHPEVAKQQFQESYFWVAEDRTFIGDLKGRWAKVRALLAIGIENFLDIDREWTDNSPEVVQFYKQAKQREIRVALGLRGRLDDPIKLLQKVLKTLGVKLKSRPKASGGNPIYIIDRKTWNEGDRLAILECLSRKWKPDRQPEK